MIFGQLSYSQINEMASDVKRVDWHNLPAGRIAKLTMFVDGQGAGNGDGLLRALVYDGNQERLAAGVSVLIPDDMPPTWIDLPFDERLFPEGVEIPSAGRYGIGAHRGGVSLAMRNYVQNPAGAGGISDTDTYDDGSAFSFTTPTVLVAQQRLFASMFTSWMPSADVPDLHAAGYGFATAQRRFSTSGVDPRTRRRAVIGWHGTLQDPLRGAYCLVRSGGEFADLLGERIKITTRGLRKSRSVAVYVHNEAAILDDLSVPRRMFMSLGLPSDDTVDAVVEVLKDA